MPVRPTIFVEKYGYRNAIFESTNHRPVEKKLVIMINNILSSKFHFQKWWSGFCFRKTRPVTFPDFCWCSTLCLIILQWWRHKHDNLPCTYTPTGDLSVTYDVTVQMSLVTSLVTKNFFWILFPKITVGDIPEMLSMKVNGQIKAWTQG